MKRIFLYLVTNLAVLVVLGVVLSAVTAYLATRGIYWNIPGLDQRNSVVGVLVIAAVFGFGGAFISLAMSKWLAKVTTGARIIDEPRSSAEQWLRNTVRRLARQAQIGEPEVAIYESPVPNAFATGMSRNKALVAVSTGLLDAMTQDQIEAVLGHEVSHVANGDMVTLALIQGTVNTFVIVAARVVGGIVDRSVFRTERGYGPGYFLTVLVAEIVFGILASLIVLWFSRRREFRADAGGAYLAGRNKMIGALQALQQTYNETALPSQFKAFGISGGLGSGVRLLFSSHPPLEARIKALQESK